MLWEALGGFGRRWKAVVGLERLWKVWEGFGRLLDVLGCFGWFWEALAASVRLCQVLVQWMLWKVLEALGVFERYGRLLESFRKL